MFSLFAVAFLATSAPVYTPAQGWGMSPEERAWRSRHPEIPLYAPYTPGYGPYIDHNGVPRFQGTPAPNWREEYAPVQYDRIFRCWRMYGRDCRY